MERKVSPGSSELSRNLGTEILDTPGDESNLAIERHYNGSCMVWSVARDKRIDNGVTGWLET